MTFPFSKSSSVLPFNFLWFVVFVFFVLFITIAVFQCNNEHFECGNNESHEWQMPFHFVFVFKDTFVSRRKRNVIYRTNHFDRFVNESCNAVVNIIVLQIVHYSEQFIDHIFNWNLFKFRVWINFVHNVLYLSFVIRRVKINKWLKNVYNLFHEKFNVITLNKRFNKQFWTFFIRSNN